MQALACPIAKIDARVESVLELLELRNWGKWIDGRVQSVTPDGPMVAGQEAVIKAPAFGREWTVRVKVMGIDHARHRIRYDVYSPFGIKNQEDLEYVRLTDHTCEVRYNCHFSFADGWRGFLIKLLLGRRLIEEPKVSIARLKAAAEREYAAWIR